MERGEGSVHSSVRSTDVRPVLVGEGPSPTYLSHPSIHPLYGRPARVIWSAAELGDLGLSDARIYIRLRWLARLENLCKGKWDLREAESTAAVIYGERPDATFVLFGRRVARAFGCRDLPWYEQHSYCGSAKVYVVPHPSGLNRMWNDADMRQCAGTTIRRALGLVA